MLAGLFFILQVFLNGGLVDLVSFFFVTFFKSGKVEKVFFVIR